MATDRPTSARPSSSATKGRISLYVPEGDGRRIRAAFTRSSVRAEHPSFSDWATGVLLAAVAELERRENGGRPFPGG